MTTILTGGVKGPASSTDGGLTVFDGTGGKTIKQHASGAPGTAAFRAVGIASTNVLAVDATAGAPNDDEFARFTASGIEGRTAAEVRTDLSLGTVATIGTLNPTGATATFTSIPATYRYLVLVGTGVSCDTVGSEPIVRISTNNGSSYASTGYLMRTTNTFNRTTLFATGGVSTPIANSWDFVMSIFNYQTGRTAASFVLFRDDDALVSQGISAYIGSASPVNAIQVLLDAAGNFDGSTTITLYGGV